jgi:hypothetical protein
MKFRHDSRDWDSFCETWVWEPAQVCRLLFYNHEPNAGRTSKEQAPSSRSTRKRPHGGLIPDSSKRPDIRTEPDRDYDTGTPRNRLSSPMINVFDVVFGAKHRR